MQNRTLKFVFIILSTLFLFRIISFITVYSNNPQKIMRSDSRYYYNGAKTLKYLKSFCVSMNDHTPQTIIPPGYSLYLSFFFSIFGDSLFFASPGTFPSLALFKGWSQGKIFLFFYY